MAEISKPVLQLPTPPPLRNQHTPPYVPYRICGYAMSMPDLLAWADKKGIRVGAREFERQREVVRRIGRKLPSQLMAVSDDQQNNAPCLCFALASNLNEHEMSLSQNVARIRKFQKVLKTTEPPRWFKPEEA